MAPAAAAAACKAHTGLAGSGRPSPASSTALGGRRPIPAWWRRPVTAGGRCRAIPPVPEPATPIAAATTATALPLPAPATAAAAGCCWGRWGATRPRLAALLAPGGAGAACAAHLCELCFFPWVDGGAAGACLALRPVLGEAHAVVQLSLQEQQQKGGECGVGGMQQGTKTREVNSRTLGCQVGCSCSEFPCVLAAAPQAPGLHSRCYNPWAGSRQFCPLLLLGVTASC
jgi:hypothetical protein